MLSGGQNRGLGSEDLPKCAGEEGDHEGAERGVQEEETH